MKENPRFLPIVSTHRILFNFLILFHHFEGRKMKQNAVGTVYVMLTKFVNRTLKPSYLLWQAYAVWCWNIWNIDSHRRSSWISWKLWYFCRILRNEVKFSSIFDHSRATFFGLLNTNEKSYFLVHQAIEGEWNYTNWMLSRFLAHFAWCLWEFPSFERIKL